MPPGCARLAGCGCWISPVLAQASGLAEGGQRKNVLRAASAGTPACRGPERLEQLAREGVLPGLVLGVPLNAEREDLGAAHADGFRRAVFGLGLHRQTRGNAIEALPVQRVHHQGACDTGRLGQGRKGPVGPQGHRVVGTVLDVEFRMLGPAMIEATWHLVDAHMEGAAEGDIQFLIADRKSTRLNSSHYCAYRMP